MDPSGHSTIEFDSTNTTDLASAERRFNKLLGKGFIPAETRGEGNHHVPCKGKREFDPNSDETIFIPALKGG
jgi:hypothetical protein